MILDGDRDELGLYVREVADLIGLKDWTVGVADDPPDAEDANAEVNVPFGRHWACIAFPLKWAEREPEDLRRTVVHELIHCHLWSMDQRVSDLYGVLGSAAHDLFSKAYHEALELAVDAIATAWAERLPLPVKEKVA